MPQGNCPTLQNYIAGEQCEENFAGMGSVVYAFERNKVPASAISMSGNTYTLTPPTGFKLYKFECKEEKQNLQGSSQGPRQGFVITGTFVLEAVDKATSLIARGLNNLDLCYIFPESDTEAQILYDPVRKVRIDSEGLTTDTGTAASDERITTVSMKLGPVKFPNLYVNTPSGGWDQYVELSATSE